MDGCDLSNLKNLDLTYPQMSYFTREQGIGNSSTGTSSYERAHALKREEIESALCEQYVYSYQSMGEDGRYESTAVGRVATHRHTH
jgi:hypothetical protein